MLIPSHWAKARSEATTPDGRRIPFQLWRGSTVSADDAERQAQEAAGRVADRIRRGEGFPERYSYGERALREPLVRDLRVQGGGVDAVVTRNSYGALVLNTTQACFIDVDVAPAAAPQPSAPDLIGSLMRLVGLSGPAPAAAPADPAAEALGRLRAWVAQRPDWSVRVYRTSAGLRYLVTHAPFTPGGAESEAAMRALGADAKYVQLCRAQKSFRARLTPKPWRIGAPVPHVRFPYESAGEEAEIAAWVEEYDAASSGYATCTLLEVIGSGRVHPTIQPVLDLHDTETRAEEGLPLA